MNKYYAEIDSLIEERKGVVIQGRPGTVCLETAMGYIAYRHGIEEAGFEKTFKKINGFDIGRYLTYYLFMAAYQKEYHEAIKSFKKYPFLVYLGKDLWYQYAVFLLNMAVDLPFKTCYLVYFDYPGALGSENLTYSKEAGIKLSCYYNNKYELRNYTVPPNVYLIRILMTEKNRQDLSLTDEFFPAVRIAADPGAIANADIRKLFYLIDEFIVSEKDFRSRDDEDVKILDIVEYYRLGERYFMGYPNVAAAAEGVIDVLYSRMRELMPFGSNMVSLQDRLITKLAGIIKNEFGIDL